MSRPPGYALDVETGALDAMRFEEAADDARRALAAGDAAAALAHAERARSEWRGDVLVDFPYEEFAEAERTRLTERRVGLEQDRAAALLELDRPADAADVAEALAAVNPLREQAWELLMLARYRSGRQADALRAFQDARRVLGEGSASSPAPPCAGSKRRSSARTGRSTAAARRRPPPRPSRLHRPRPPPSVRSSSAAPTSSIGCTRPSRPPHRACAFALVSGEAGIGKTTLVRAATEQSGLAVVWGRSQEQASDGALGRGARSWPDRAAGQHRPRARAAHRSGAVTTSAHRSTACSCTTRSPACSRRGRGPSRSSSSSRTSTGRRRLLRLLDYLATELQDGIGGRARHLPPRRGRRAVVDVTLGSLARRPDLVRVELTGLGPEHVRSFAREVGDLDLDPAAAEALHGRTAGNRSSSPSSCGCSRPSGARTRRGCGDVPASVRDVVRRRSSGSPTTPGPC